MLKRNKLISIYSSSHGPMPSYISKAFKNIHVGAAVNDFDYGNSIKDNQGLNISLKNPYYCELTAQYWAWKNDLESTHFGFVHYRRHLNFSETKYNTDIWGCIIEEEVNSDYESKYGFDNTVIENLLSEYDILLPEKWDVRNAGSLNNLDHYKNGEFLHIEDYEAAIEIIFEKYPEYIEYLNSFNKSSLGYYTNLFVMKKEHFHAYSEWLFGILEELETKVSIQNYNAQEQRVIGHIAERLFNVYIEKLIVDEKLKVKHLQRTFVSNVQKKTVIDTPCVDRLPFVICFDNNYAHSGGALIQSIIENSSKNVNYELNIFCDNVSAINRKNLKGLISNLSNFTMRFIDTSSLFDSSKMNVSEHFTPATYARLFIPSVFPQYEKIVFIDADMIVATDVAQLYEINIGDNKIAAVKDIVTEGFIKFNHQAPKDFPNHSSYTYLKNYLKMCNPDSYFQAGLLIMNISKIIEDNDHQRMIQAISERKYWYHDQDILNMIFEDSVFYLDLSWNVYHGNGTTNNFFPNLKLSTYLEFLQARDNLKIVHYAGDQKPWINTEVDYAELYFSAVKKTPWAFKGDENSNKVIRKIVSDIKNGQVTLNLSELKRHILYFYNEESQLSEKKINQIITGIFEQLDSNKPIPDRRLFILKRIKREFIILCKKFFLIFAPLGSKRFAIARKLYLAIVG